MVQSAAAGKKIIAGTGCESTWQTIKLTNACARLGAHAALVVTPFYYGGRMNEAALLQHYTAVADKSDIPILIYNVTKFTHISVSVGLQPGKTVAAPQHHRDQGQLRQCELPG